MFAGVAAMDDELFYEQAAAEVAANRIQAGLYAKAFSQADGDKTVAQARYLRLRAEQLAAEAMLAKAEMERAELKERLLTSGAPLRRFMQVHGKETIVTALILLAMLTGGLMIVSGDHDSRFLGWAIVLPAVWAWLNVFLRSLK